MPFGDLILFVYVYMGLQKSYMLIVQHPTTSNICDAEGENLQ